MVKKNNKEIKPALRIQKLSKKYGAGKNVKYAIKDLTFNVYPGQFHGFIGANGAGKTTAIKSIIGAYAQYEGEVLIHGKLNKTVEAKKHLGYIPESAKFPQGMSTEKYLTYMAYLSGYTKAKANKFAKDKIKDLGLEKLAKKSPNDFSSGQKKKVLLAQALIGDPDVIVMDEPAANLDPMAREDFFGELKKLQKEKKSILISSHILAELDDFVDSVTIIDGGKLAYTGWIKDIQDSTKGEYVFEFKKKTDRDKFEIYLNKVKANFKLKENVFIIKKQTKSTIKKYVDYIMNNKLSFYRMNSNRMDLPTIYNKYVKLGSVATGTGRKIGDK